MSDIERNCTGSPELDSLDELIADTSSLIASVYDMLEQPRRTPTTATPLLGRRSHNNSDSSGRLCCSSSSSTSPKSPKTPRLGPPTRATLLTPSSREIDREINRIDRFCEMLEHNLRTVAAEREQVSDDSTSSNSPGRSAIYSSPRNSSQRAAEQTPNLNRAPTPDVVVVDLSDSMNMPISSSNQLNMSDDVIIVTPSEVEVVDLCTPTFRRNNIRSRSNYYNRRSPNFGFNINQNIDGSGTRHQRVVPSSRRSLYSTSSHMSAQMPNDSSSSRCSISTATSTTNTATIRNQNKSQNKPTNKSPGAHRENSVATVTTENGRVPFMCAVCMESCINNQPTSTKCGHVFCANCIRQAIRLTRKCPMCNTKLTPSMLFRIYV